MSQLLSGFAKALGSPPLSAPAFLVLALGIAGVSTAQMPTAPERDGYRVSPEARAGAKAVFLATHIPTTADHLKRRELVLLLRQTHSVAADALLEADHGQANGRWQTHRAKIQRLITELRGQVGTPESLALSRLEETLDDLSVRMASARSRSAGPQQASDSGAILAELRALVPLRQERRDDGFAILSRWPLLSEGVVDETTP